MRAISNVTIVTMDPARRIITDGAIVFNGSELVAVDKSSALRDWLSTADITDGAGKVVLPGLIDTHAHADQSILRGLGDQMHWMPFLDDVIDPWLAERDPADAVLANALSMVEMLKNGTTCFVSPNVDPTDDFAALSDCIQSIGIRAVLGRFAMASEPMDDILAVTDRWQGAADGLVSMWFGLDVPRRPGDIDYPHFYEAVKKAADERGCGIVYHFCSEFEDAMYLVNRYGMRPAEWSRDNHALGGNVLLINGCQMTPDEIRILAETGTHLAHSPVANMKMATGILPVPDVLAAGVNVSLGTDGALNNNSYDMFAEMKTAVLLQNAVRHHARALTAEQVLEMATCHGARAIGRDDLGSLEPGKQADFILLDLERPNTLPMHDLISNLVFSANGSHVRDVFVAGRQVVRDRLLTGFDEAALLADINAKALRIADQLSLSTHSTWPIE